MFGSMLMKGRVDVSIIIVNYNTKELVLSCLASLAVSWRKGNRWEIFVVDNASTDGSAKALKDLVKRGGFYRHLQILQNFENIGFAKANNRAIQKSVGRYVLLLNSDTEVSHMVIEDMVTFMDARPKAGGASCKLLLPDGTLDPACHRGFPTPWAALTYFLGLEQLFPRSRLFGQYHQGYRNMEAAHMIDSPSGAFFMVRSEAIHDVGLLDEEFFMYGEDIDWAFRMNQHGWEIWFNPLVTVIHHKKQSGRANVDLVIRKQTKRHFFETMILFYEKHYRRTYPMPMTVLIILLLKIRVLLLNICSI